jgi:hypothetical protein
VLLELMTFAGNLQLSESGIYKSVATKVAALSECDDLICHPLSQDDVVHAAHNANRYLVCQAEVLETGAANDKVHAFSFQAAEQVENRGIMNYHFDPIGIKTDSAGEQLVLEEHFQEDAQELVAQHLFGRAHAIAVDKHESGRALLR